MPLSLLDAMTEARRVAVPLVYLTTTDPITCIQALTPALHTPDDHGRLQPDPVLLWNPADGLAPAGDVFARRSQDAWAKVQTLSKIPPESTMAAENALKAIKYAPFQTVCFFYVLLPSAFFQGPKILQQIWNLRDEFKSKGCMLVFLGPDASIPAGLANDILMLTEPQPSLGQLREIVQRQHRALKKVYPSVPALAPEVIDQSALSLQGLAAFSAETAVAMSLRHDGIDLPALRDQRYDRLDQVKGVTVWRGTERFADIGGLEGVKTDLLQVLNSKKKQVGAVFFLDEIDKMLAGAGGGDLSGMADEYLGLLLSYMQDHDVMGMLFLGAPGTAKTLVTKAIGNEAQRIAMSVNLNLMKDHLMGNSEANLHRFFRMATAVSGGQAIFLASCNSAARLPTALLRRFKTGRYFFDLPSDAERQNIWHLKLAKYSLSQQVLPDDAGWTGAEIDACCERAWLRDIPLVEAGQAIIPVSMAAPEEIEHLRMAAHLKYLDASTGLPFRYRSAEDQEQVDKPSRSIRLAHEKGH
jgi:hypothetical protein